MAKLVLHIGPGKCGSSTIQQFFASHEKPCDQSTTYSLLDPVAINQLNCEELDNSVSPAFAEQLSKAKIGDGTLILSHEFLFQAPCAVKNICALARDNMSDIIVVGYSRRQSDYLVSAYSQWMFRSVDRVQEVNSVLGDLGFDAFLFSGLERQLIASIANDFHSARQLSGQSIHNWFSSYDSLSKLLAEFDVKVRCGVLPGKETNINLIEDFCDKAELSLHSAVGDATEKTTNVSFHADVIEATNLAVMLGFDVPRPHASNEIIQLLSARMSPVDKDVSSFMDNLKSYIDTYYFGSNSSLCRQYELDESYFEPADEITKPEILSFISQEVEQRLLNGSEVIKSNQILCAKLIELCFKLASGDLEAAV